jgi:hypothetical protein
MSNEPEEILKEAILAYLRHCPGICLEGLRKPKKILTKDSRRRD